MPKTDNRRPSNALKPEFDIKGSYYKVRIDPRIPEGHINAEDFIGRLHAMREKVYSEFGKKCPALELYVFITLGLTHRWYGDGYEIPAFFDEDSVKHEIIHETQDYNNSALQRWSFKANCLTNRTASRVLSVFKELEVEGFPTFVSKGPDFTFSEEDVKCLKMGLDNIVSDDFYLEVFKQRRGEYTLGKNIFETIQRAGLDVVEIGLTQNPIDMLRAYEEACKRLNMVPYITVKDFSTAYGKTFGVIPK